ncbi:MAG: hypothetical protein U1D30_08780 [Planctomycetota bacterium]
MVIVVGEEHTAAGLSGGETVFCASTRGEKLIDQFFLGSQTRIWELRRHSPEVHIGRFRERSPVDWTWTGQWWEGLWVRLQNRAYSGEWKRITDALARFSHALMISHASTPSLTLAPRSF